MRITRKNSHKKLYIILLVIGVLILGVLAYSLLVSTRDNKSSEIRPLGSTDYSEPTKEQIEDGNKAKQATIDKDEASSQSEKPAPQAGEELTVSVSTTKSDGNLFIRSEITGLHATGTCLLSLQKGTEKVQKSSEIQALAKSSTCKGFDISQSELSTGEWAVTLNVTTNGKTGKTTAKVTI